MENSNTTKIAKSPEALFQELYLKQDYKSAINAIIQNKQQFKSSIFHYNLGTAYAKLGDLGPARYHLEKAILQGMNGSAALNNLNYVKSKIENEDLSNSTALSDQFINYSLNIPIEGYWSITLILMLIVLLIIKIKKMTNKYLLFFLFILSLTPILFSNFYLNKVNTAVVMKEISIYEGPSKIFQEKGKIKAGSKVVLGEFKEGWFFIKYPLPLAGWISKENLGIF
jgi:hypothetical protein